MAKFGRKGKGGLPEVSTASLPDIIFMLLFFFMVSTTMRETTIMVQQRLPKATEVKKMERKSLVSSISIGSPILALQGMYGSEPRIQLNDSYSKVADIRDYITAERENMDERERPLMTVSLRVDNKTKMGIVIDVKQELRKASALKINYSTRKVEVID
ncbi:MAG: biopolymer transporter ExbD [Bacteroidales bacterium]|jgi:biopolymer transport protein ExbD|nr:biopolymer transporter ExbD [Bacteroidales bacterium]